MNKSSWINVKDRLPENMTKVLIWFTGLYNEPKIAFYAAKAFFPNEHSDDNLTKWVTHWMPLPEEPNE